ncbi:unnamed protein product [Arctogadus glacialis]
MLLPWRWDIIGARPTESKHGLYWEKATVLRRIILPSHCSYWVQGSYSLSAGGERPQRPPSEQRPSEEPAVVVEPRPALQTSQSARHSDLKRPQHRSGAFAVIFSSIT